MKYIEYLNRDLWDDRDKWDSTPAEKCFYL